MNEFFRRVLFLPRQASTVAPGLDRLHFAVILTTLAGAVLVVAVAVYFLVRYGRPRSPSGAALSGLSGADASGAALPPPARPGKTGATVRFEVLSAAFLLLLFLSFWVVGFGQFVELESPPKDALEIQVIAKQWMWTFGYGNGTGSKAVVYVPANRPVKLSMTSRDVIHSFYVPDFRVKKDVIPGRTTELWFEARAPGRYPVYCAEYCGEGHSTMRATVVALSDEDYAHAIARLPALDIAGPAYQEPALVTQTPARGLSLAEMGERVATEQGCMRCHTPDGTPHIGPTWAGMYEATIPLVGGGVAVADPEYLTESMMDPRAKIHLGYPPVMPSYQGVLTAPQVGAIIEYLRALSLRKPSNAAQPLAPAGLGSIRLPDVEHPERLPSEPGSASTPPAVNPVEKRP
jgi:cytochrome c oxidase subunit 2